MSRTEKRPWVLLPAGPPAWASYEQIHGGLVQLWTALGWRIESVWFPRPRISHRWVSQIEREASCLIFATGLGQYECLWLLSKLRADYDLKIPAVFMAAADFTKGFQSVSRYIDFLSRKDVLVVNSTPEYNLTRLAFKHGFSTHTIPLPTIPTKPPLSLEERGRLKERLGYSPNQKLILYGGRISVQKNLHGLLRIFRSLNPLKENLKLVILGTPDEFGNPQVPCEPRPRYLHFLNKLISDWRLEQCVQFKGSLSQELFMDHLRCCDVHVSLTVHSGEDFGYSIAQGLSVGAPTLVTHWGGGVDFSNKGGAIGVRVTPTLNGPKVDLSGAAQKLKALLKPAPNEAARSSALRMYEKHFSPALVSKLWAEAALTAQAYTQRQPKPQLSELFQRDYFLQRLKRETDPLALSSPPFTSPTDPLYLEIQKIYSGQQAVVTRRTRGEVSLDPWFSLARCEQGDPISPFRTKQIEFSNQERREIKALFLAERPIQMRELLQTEWGPKLIELGGVIK